MGSGREEWLEIINGEFTIFEPNGLEHETHWESLVSPGMTQSNIESITVQFNPEGPGRRVKNPLRILREYLRV